MSQALRLPLHVSQVFMYSVAGTDEAAIDLVKKYHDAAVDGLSLLEDRDRQGALVVMEAMSLNVVRALPTANFARGSLLQSSYVRCCCMLHRAGHVD